MSIRFATTGFMLYADEQAERVVAEHNGDVDEAFDFVYVTYKALPPPERAPYVARALEWVGEQQYTRGWNGIFFMGEEFHYNEELLGERVPPPDARPEGWTTEMENAMIGIVNDSIHINIEEPDEKWSDVETEIACIIERHGCADSNHAAMAFAIWDHM